MILGSVLVAVVLGALLLGLGLIWRRPFLALGVLVAGMAFHNLALMVLLRLGTPQLLVRAFQTWKEFILLVLAVKGFLMLYRAWKAGRLPRLIASDWLALGFAFLACLYFVLPQSWLGGQSTLPARAVALRAAMLLPSVYFFGRAFALRRGPRDEVLVAWLIAGAGAVVGAFGLVELWLLPTRIWVSWGENLFNLWLGFDYKGPGHLPDNFYQTLSGGSLLLRRMVSTYLSPLGIAYTGLLAVPIAVALVERARTRGHRTLAVAVLVLTLLLAGILFSITRLAIVVLVFEVLLLGIGLRRRWLFALTPVLAVLVLGMLYVYPLVGPVVDRNLNPARANYKTSIVSSQDPSAQEHGSFLINDVLLIAKHPLGVGMGSAVFRYGGGNAAGESAVLSAFADMGLLGGLVYIGMYLFAILYGYRAWRKSRSVLGAALPLVAAAGGIALFPITMTSDLWGATAVTFLFWWAAGHSATLATASEPAAADSATPPDDRAA